jgi:putative PIN family toxin of toxin-antitoxin system
MLPLRLVLDTNVVISAAIKPVGLQRTVLTVALTKPARVYVSEPILEEYREVLSRPELRIGKGLRQQLLQLIKNRSYSVIPARRIEITSDPDDNMFLECADSARADYLVTGNQKHFPKFWKKTKIITPREFIGLVAPHLIL